MTLQELSAKWREKAKLPPAPWDTVGDYNRCLRDAADELDAALAQISTKPTNQSLRKITAPSITAWEILYGPLDDEQRREMGMMLASFAAMAIGRYFSDAQMPETGWQPIETAPKDGTRVLLSADVDGRIVVGRMGIVTRRWHSVPGKGEMKPTHWQPLPSPPKLTDRVKGLRER